MASSRARRATSRRPPTAPRSRWSSRPTASGSSSFSRSRAGTDGTSTACPSSSRPRARRRPTTSPRPARGSATAATSTASATTCSWARSTPSPGRPARASTCSPGRRACRSPRSPATGRRRGSAGWWSAARTTARARAASTRPCRRATSVAGPFSSGASPASTRPT